MSDLKIQGEVQISAEGAESALDRVADKAGEMARRMQVEGDKAGKAVDGIGTGATKAAEEFTRSEGRMSDSIKRATKNLQELGKTASQKIELRINDRGLDAAKFEPMLAKLRELEAAQVRVATSAPKMGAGLQNTSYQLQDFIVQVNGGTDATRALSMQLPQMLIGFGALGAGIGVVAALLPNLISAFGGTGESTKKFSDAMSDFGTAIGDVGSTVKTFDLDPLYKQFNDSSAAVRAATIEQIKFQQEYIKTTQLVAQKKFDESFSDLGGYDTIDKLAGAFGNTSAEKLAKQLGLQLAVAQELLPVLKGLNKGTEDIGLAFEKAGQKLLGGNQRAVAYAKSLADMAKTERDAAAASSALSAAQEKTAAAGSKGAIAVKERTKAVKEEVDTLASLLATLNAKDSGFDQSYVKNVETLLKAFDAGKLTLGEFNAVFARYVAMQPGAIAAEKERAAALQEAWKIDVQRTDALAKEADALDKQLEKVREENALIGLTRGQTDALKLERLDDAIAIKQQQLALAEKHSDSATEIELIRDQVTALQELRAVTASTQVKQANADSIKEQTKAWEKFSDDIERSLTDALMRSFEAGDDFGKAFAKSLENTFKTMVLKFAVQAVIDPVMGTVKSALGGGSSLLGTAKDGYSIYSGFNSQAGYNTIGNIASLTGNGAWGAGFTNGIGGVSEAIGAYNTAAFEAIELGNTVAAAEYSAAATSLAEGAAAAEGALGSIAAAVPYLAVAVAAIALISTQLTGGTPHKGGVAFSDSNTDLAATNMAQATMMMGEPDFQSNEWYKSPEYGQAMLPVAAAFADTLNGVLNRYGLSDAKVGMGFSADGEDPSRGVFHVFTEPSADSTAAVGAYGQEQLVGIYERFSVDAQQGMQEFTANLSKYLITALAASDLSDPINAYLDKFNGTISEGAANAVAAALTRDWLDPFIEQIDVAALSFDEITAAIVRFSEIATLKPLFDALSIDIYAFGDDLANAFGGAQNAGAAMSAYYDAFYTEAEKTEALTAQVADAFADLNLAMPDSREAFRDMVEGLDLTTQAGINTYAALLNLAPAFTTLTDAVKTSQAEINKATGEYLSGKLGAGKTWAFSYSSDDPNNPTGRTMVDLVLSEEALQRAAEKEGARLVQAIFNRLPGGASAGGYSVPFRDPNAPLYSAEGIELVNNGYTKQAMALSKVLAGSSGGTDYAANGRAYKDQQAEMLARLETMRAEDDAAALAKQSWQDQLDILTGKKTEREVQLANALKDADAATADLIKQIYSLEDAQEASRIASEKLEAIANERYGLESELLQLQGNTAALRARELAELDISNIALQEQIWALEDQQEAADEATRAAEDLANAWESITDSLLGQIDRIRGTMAEESTNSVAALQARFAIATAQTRAGDQTAAGSLSEYAAQLSGSLSADTTGSRIEMILEQARIAESLQTTSDLLNGGTISPIIAPLPTGADSNAAVAKSVTDLKAEIVILQQRLAEIQTNTRRTADAVNGNPDQPIPVETV